MAIGDRVKGLGALFEGGLKPPRLPSYPSVAVEIAPDGIVAVRVALDRKSGRVVMRQVERRSLPPGAIEPSLNRPNILMDEPVALAVADALSKLSPPDHRVSILIPDQVARVAHLSFVALPRTRRELAELVRFRMAKSLPFKPEEAVMDLMLLNGGAAVAPAPAGASVLAVFLHKAVLEQYEGLFTRIGYWPGLVGLSSFELFNLFRPRLETESGSKDALLLNVTADYLTLLIFSGERLVFYRCKAHPSDGGPEESLKAVGREVYTSLAFYQEKLLGRGIDRAFLRASGMPRDGVLRAVASELACPVAWLELGQMLTVADTVVLDDEGAARAAPGAGAVAGRRG
jgi:hypothetical protein